MAAIIVSYFNNNILQTFLLFLLKYSFSSEQHIESFLKLSFYELFRVPRSPKLKGGHLVTITIYQYLLVFFSFSSFTVDEKENNSVILISSKQILREQGHLNSVHAAQGDEEVRRKRAIHTFRIFSPYISACRGGGRV